MFVKHCMARLPPSAVPILQHDIAQLDNGVFTVKSQSTPTTFYTVRLQSESNADIPRCDCIDWQLHHLPCKHLLAILLTAGWDSLPESYRNFPQFSLDSQLATFSMPAPPSQESDDGDDLTVQLPMAIAATVTASDSQTVSQTADTAATVQQARSTDDLQSSVRQTLSTIMNCTYLITDRHFLQKSLQSLQQQLQEFHYRADRATGRLRFRHSRKLVKASITARQQRRRVSVIRGRRQLRRRKQGK